MKWDSSIEMQLATAATKKLIRDAMMVEAKAATNWDLLAVRKYVYFQKQNYGSVALKNINNLMINN